MANSISSIKSISKSFNKPFIHKSSNFYSAACVCCLCFWSPVMQNCEANIHRGSREWGVQVLWVSPTLYSTSLGGLQSLNMSACRLVHIPYLQKASQWSWNHPVDIVYIAACLPDSHMFSFMVPFNMYISKFSKSQVFLGILVCTKFSLKLNLKLSAQSQPLIPLVPSLRHNGTNDQVENLPIFAAQCRMLPCSIIVMT